MIHMLKVLDILDGTGAPAKLALMATARTPMRYKQLFGRDLFRDFLALTDGAEADGAEKYADEAVAVVERLAFTMASQASGADFRAICADVETAMGDWLDKLDSAAIPSAAGDIIGVYMDSKRTGSEPKKK